MLDGDATVDVSYVEWTGPVTETNNEGENSLGTTDNNSDTNTNGSKGGGKNASPIPALVEATREALDKFYGTSPLQGLAELFSMGLERPCVTAINKQPTFRLSVVPSSEEWSLKDAAVITSWRHLKLPLKLLRDKLGSVEESPSKDVAAIVASLEHEGELSGAQWEKIAAELARAREFWGRRSGRVAYDADFAKRQITSGAAKALNFEEVTYLDSAGFFAYVKQIFEDMKKEWDRVGADERDPPIVTGARYLAVMHKESINFVNNEGKYVYALDNGKVINLDEIGYKLDGDKVVNLRGKVADEEAYHLLASWLCEIEPQEGDLDPKIFNAEKRTCAHQFWSWLRCVYPSTSRLAVEVFKTWAKGTENREPDKRMHDLCEDWLKDPENSLTKLTDLTEKLRENQREAHKKKLKTK